MECEGRGLWKENTPEGGAKQVREGGAAKRKFSGHSSLGLVQRVWGGGRLRTQLQGGVVPLPSPAPGFGRRLMGVITSLARRPLSAKINSPPKGDTWGS